MSETWIALDQVQWTLGELKFHWGGAYTIYRSMSAWRARRRDDPDVVLTAPTPDELLGLIRLDYARQAVPR